MNILRATIARVCTLGVFATLTACLSGQIGAQPLEFASPENPLNAVVDETGQLSGARQGVIIDIVRIPSSNISITSATWELAASVLTPASLSISDENPSTIVASDLTVKVQFYRSGTAEPADCNASNADNLVAVSGLFGTGMLINGIINIEPTSLAGTSLASIQTAYQEFVRRTSEGGWNHKICLTGGSILLNGQPLPRGTVVNIFEFMLKLDLFLDRAPVF